MEKQRRFSKQRQIIYDVIKNNPVHPTADVIYHMLKEDYPDLSLGTVYRNLNVLTEMGLIIKVTSDLESEHYDGNIENHYHFICDKCHSMFDVDFPYQNDIVSKVGENSKHDILNYHIMFSGLCSNCKSKSK